MDKDMKKEKADKELAAQCRQMGEYLMKSVQSAIYDTPSKYLEKMK